ncbi:MAG: C40 family peptidase [Ignavibacteria bacterium]|nr:C40 family peptidase [Ignavibacteria bacterium]MBI3766514.1 C40 family peptidase [Ignavibacteriales bacterium]
MPREVSSCEHISGNALSHLQNRVAHLLSALHVPSIRVTVLLSYVIIFSLLVGCSASSPRSSSSPMVARDSTHLQAGRGGFGDSRREKNTPPTRSTHRDENNLSINRHRALVEIMSLMGTPYDFSGTDSTGIDCSGFTAKIYRDIMGQTLPHSAREQFTVGMSVNRDDLKFGDLVFFNTTGAPASHVGMYVGDGLFAHVSISLGVTISPITNGYYSERYVGARRVIR